LKKLLSVISAFFIISKFCVFAEGASALTAPVIEVTWVGTSTMDTVTGYIPSWSEVLVAVKVNGGTDNGEGTIEPGGVALNWQVNSQTAGVFMRSMPVLYNLLYQDYRYMKRMDPYGSGTKMYWWVTAQNIDGETSSTEVDSFLLGTLTLDHEPLPSVFKILGNYPNPFNPITNINFSVAYAAEVDLSVYALGGKLVRQFHLGALPSGNQSVAWEGKDNLGNDVPSGIYVYRLQSEFFSEARKMTLLK
jgi:hypothetical protein